MSMLKMKHSPRPRPSSLPGGFLSIRRHVPLYRWLYRFLGVMNHIITKPMIGIFLLSFTPSAFTLGAFTPSAFTLGAFTLGAFTLGACSEENSLSDHRQPFPTLQSAITKQEASRWDITIDGDGKGLPKGQGSVRWGKELYAEHCASCHGRRGQGRTARELVGGIGSLNDPDAPEQTIGSYWPYAPTLFDTIWRSMPPDSPFTLSADATYALSAYILHLNGLIDEDVTLDAKSLAAIIMPNRDGFIEIYPTGRE